MTVKQTDFAVCNECGFDVDLEDDPQAYDEDYDGLCCQDCREKLAENEAEDRRLDDPRHGQAKLLNRGY